jgi:RIO1 family
MLISSPYIPGNHYATSAKQLLGVVKHLERLHKKGYVHGDIRAYNIIFAGDTGYLIDFDNSGGLDLESTRYPEGYKRVLKDGSRKGIEGALVRKWHDWRDLICVLFSLHHIEPPEGNPPNTDQEELQRLREAEALRKEKVFLRDKFAYREDPSRDDIRRLKQFLTDADSWNVSLSEDFINELTERGLLVADGAGRDMSGIATGSTINSPFVLVPVE